MNTYGKVSIASFLLCLSALTHWWSRSLHGKASVLSTRALFFRGRDKDPPRSQSECDGLQFLKNGREHRPATFTVGGSLPFCFADYDSSASSVTCTLQSDTNEDSLSLNMSSADELLCSSVRSANKICTVPTNEPEVRLTIGARDGAEDIRIKCTADDQASCSDPPIRLGRSVNLGNLLVNDIEQFCLEMPLDKGLECSFTADSGTVILNLNYEDRGDRPHDDEICSNSGTDVSCSLVASVGTIASVQVFVQEYSENAALRCDHV